MKVLAIKADSVNHEPEIIELDNNLESLQAYVGGNIELIWLHKNYLLICNETGKFDGLNISCIVASGDTLVDVIAGDCFICCDDGCGDFADYVEEPGLVTDTGSKWIYPAVNM